MSILGIFSSNFLHRYEVKLQCEPGSRASHVLLRISTDKGPSRTIESFAIIKLCVVSKKKTKQVNIYVTYTNK